MYSGANYSNKQPNSTAYIKTFVTGTQESLWKTISHNNGTLLVNAITPSSKIYDNVYIPGDLYVDGSIVNPSDMYLKDNIEELDEDVSTNLMKLKPRQFVFKKDILKNRHYGFVSQEFEEQFPELVLSKIDKNMGNLKAINYLEIVPLLVYQVQKMQKEIDDLKEEINKMKK
jgi:hypothetical protein